MNTDEEAQMKNETLEVISTEYLRDKIRKFSQHHREESRAKSTDAFRFGLGEIHAQVEELCHIKVKDVHGLVKRIKRRKHATLEDIYRLSHAFLQSIDNIQAFVMEPGALQVIIKELTGIDSERQIGALECICNLSLGEGPVCEKIANLAGSYVVTYLDSLDERLKRTSIWTISNLVATSTKAAQTLVQMEIVSKLWNIYLDDRSDKDSTTDFREDAAVCLQLLLVYKATVLRAEDSNAIKKGFCRMTRNKPAGQYHLQLLFHTDVINPTTELSVNQLHYIIEYILGNLCDCKDFKTTSNRLRILYAVRLLANILTCQQHALDVLMQQLREEWNMNLEDLLNKIFEFRAPRLSLEAIYLLRQLTPPELGNNYLPAYRMDKLHIHASDFCMK